MCQTIVLVIVDAVVSDCDSMAVVSTLALG